MTFEQYTADSAFTALYPPELQNLYPALGLAGEAGEVCNKVKKIARDDGGEVTDARAAQVIDECGGVLWYAAALCRDEGITLSPRVNVLPKYLPPVYHAALLMAYRAGMVAGLEADERSHADDIAEHLEHAVQYCHAVLYHVDSNLELAMELNLKKLRDRKARGTLQGDGDNR